VKRVSDGGRRGDRQKRRKEANIERENREREV